MCDKVYTISNDKGFLSKNLIPKGKFKAVSGSNMSLVWITSDRFKAEELSALLLRKGFLNKYRDGDGIVETPNTDGLYDEDLKAMESFTTF